MKINEVEALVGITKKNIRFYEAEGLLAPRRNSENGYRDYGESDVSALLCIKLLRKLGVPLEEIRRMQKGSVTVSGGMCRHLAALERDREALDASARLCAELAQCPEPLETLDALAWLARMEQLETEGTTFMDKQKQDTKRRSSAAAVLCAVVMAALMGGAIWLMLWAFEVDPAGAPPLPLLIFFIAIPAVTILGIGIALVQRLREIGKNEEDEAKRY